MSKILKQFRICSGVDIPDETLNRWIEEGLEELTPENNMYYTCSGKKLILMVLEEDDFINVFVCDINKDYFGNIKELKNTVKDTVKFNGGKYYISIDSGPVEITDYSVIDIPDYNCIEIPITTDESHLYPTSLDEVCDKCVKYCSCEAPNTIHNSANGKSFLYCKNCGKEKNGS